MSAIVFQAERPLTPSAPNRADVACFVGLVGRRSGAVPRSVAAWLDASAWTRWRPESATSLLDVPVPIERWAAFDALYAWDERPIAGTDATAGTYLGAAVRAFFAEGGRRCYVVRVGDPLPLGGADDRAARIAALVPGWPFGFDATPADPASWRGVGHVFGLPDVSMLLVPDLPELVASPPEPPELQPRFPPVPERFMACDEPAPPPPRDALAVLHHPPLCDGDGYAEWARALQTVAAALAMRAREVQLIAAVPLPSPRSAEAANLARALFGRWLDAAPGGGRGTLATAFLQLAYPWVRTRGSDDLPGALQPPDGTLAGAIARRALERGCHRSAAGAPLLDVQDVRPLLPARELAPTPARAVAGARGAPRTLADRVSLVGRDPLGWRVLSDVTASADESYRPAGVNRLVSALVRAARRVGEAHAFEPSGESLWERVRGSLESLLDALWRDGALRGETADEAFGVRCDRGTMTQADLDAGRTIAVVRFDAALPIEQITIVLALDAAGVVTHAAPEAALAGLA